MNMRGFTVPHVPINRFLKVLVGKSSVDFINLKKYRHEYSMNLQYYAHESINDFQSLLDSESPLNWS